MQTISVRSQQHQQQNKTFFWSAINEQKRPPIEEMALVLGIYLISFFQK